MRFLACIACLLLLKVTAFGQDTLGVILNEPEDITLLLERHIQFMEELEQIEGYRVQLGSANRLTEANELKEKYEKEYKGKEAYIIFSEPTYRVRIGDFHLGGEGVCADAKSEEGVSRGVCRSR